MPYVKTRLRRFPKQFSLSQLVRVNGANKYEVPMLLFLLLLSLVPRERSLVK